MSISTACSQLPLEELMKKVRALKNELNKVTAVASLLRLGNLQWIDESRAEAEQLFRVLPKTEENSLPQEIIEKTEEPAAEKAKALIVKQVESSAVDSTAVCGSKNTVFHDVHSHSHAKGATPSLDSIHHSSLTCRRFVATPLDRHTGMLTPVESEAAKRLARERTAKALLEMFPPTPPSQYAKEPALEPVFPSITGSTQVSCTTFGVGSNRAIEKTVTEWEHQSRTATSIQQRIRKQGKLLSPTDAHARVPPITVVSNNPPKPPSGPNTSRPQRHPPENQRMLFRGDAVYVPAGINYREPFDGSRTKFTIAPTTSYSSDQPLLLKDNPTIGSDVHSAGQSPPRSSHSSRSARPDILVAAPETLNDFHQHRAFQSHYGRRLQQEQVPLAFGARVQAHHVHLNNSVGRQRLRLVMTRIDSTGRPILPQDFLPPPSPVQSQIPEIAGTYIIAKGDQGTHHAQILTSVNTGADILTVPQTSAPDPE